jgi:hypothetical protein
MSGSYEDRLAVALSELHAAHPLLNAEVAAYPTPISGCDVQFNRLLSDRTRIANALQALRNSPELDSRYQMVSGIAV